MPKQPRYTRAPHTFINPFGGNGTGITVSCSNPDIIMKGLDWYQLDEAYNHMEWGTYEMKNYELVDGAPKKIAISS